MARRSLIRVVGFNRVHMYTRARRPVLLKAWVMLGSKSLQSHSNPSDKRHRGVWRKKVTEEEILSWTPDPITCPLSGSARRSSCFSSSFFSSFTSLSSPDSSSRAGCCIAICAIWGNIIIKGFIIICCCWSLWRFDADIGMAQYRWQISTKETGSTRTLELTKIAAHTPQISTSVQWLSIVFFFEFYIFLLVFWDHFRTFERFWEILRDFERFWEILRNFRFNQQYYFSITMVPMPLILRDFEKFWENSSQFFFVLFSRFDLLPHGIAGICCDNGWSHMQSVSYLLVVLQLLPRLDSWHHCTMKRRHLWQFHCASLTMFAMSLALYCIRTRKLL